LDTAPLVALAEVVAAAGHPVVRANLPHHERGGPAPHAERSVPAVGAILAAARVEVDDERPWVLGGRSYGARVASMAIADGLPATGLLCSSYPLHPPERPEELRVAHWPRVTVPVLFLQGDADPMAELALLATSRRMLAGSSHLVVVPGGDHALRVTRARSPDGKACAPAAATHGAAGEVASWLHGLGTGRTDATATGRGPDG
jgi:predicted alpha/beta-hydrolase family hydrolase